MKRAPTRKTLIWKCVLVVCGLVLLLLSLSWMTIIVAILFPTFRSAQEKAHQATCISKLNQIAMATKQYFMTYGRYPAEVKDISPYLGIRVSGGKATRGKDSLVCPDDETFEDHAFTSVSLPYSSYYDTQKGIVWNYWGYEPDGFAYTRDDPAYNLAMAEAGVKDAKKFPRLANRRAPDNTIITHCLHHRPKTGSNELQQLDTVVRVDGSAKAIPWKNYDWVKQPK